MDRNDRPQTLKLRCPTCGREDEVPRDFRWRPFCSRRCKIIDLGNWLDEVYRIPGPPPQDGDEASRDHDAT
ncbi:MAG: DNA gyrase inhibitor YacG [Nannocystaceae bacterium]